MAAADDTSSAVDEPSAKIPKTFQQKLRVEWLHQSEFQDWLVDTSSSCRDPRCLVCKKTVPCGRSGLISHGNSQSHNCFVKSSEDVLSQKSFFERQETQRYYRTIVSFLQSMSPAFHSAKPVNLHL